MVFPRQVVTVEEGRQVRQADADLFASEIVGVQHRIWFPNEEQRRFVEAALLPRDDSALGFGHRLSFGRGLAGHGLRFQHKCPFQ
jgi:hypothetical protein